MSDLQRTVTVLPDSDFRPRPDGDLVVGAPVGPYTLLEKLGEGGFGVVFLAEQREPVRRRVALKVLKLGMDTREVVSRFEQERQTLAVMDHPGIARVFGAGSTEQGRPYFVMEYVAGTPITHFCDKSALSIPDRIRLYVDVCLAIQHAHHKGVIHRDLKPGNILVSMVDGKPTPKIIDFGIAKAASGTLHERSLVTQHGQFIGTPEYMSPEQASESGIDIDTRSDIYSLGVVLYELLTGLRPFDVASRDVAQEGDLRRLIRESQPARASTKVSSMQRQGDSGTVADSKPAPTRGALETIARRRSTDPEGLRRQLRGDLDWILLKAMEKDRARRYDSASAFADDLLRHLRNEPVVAGPPSAAYRIGKFVKRHRGSVTASALLVVLLAVAAILSTYLYRRAEKALVLAKEAQSAAEAESTKTRDALAFVTGMFESVNPDEAQGREVTVRDVLDKAAKTADQTLTQQPEIRGFAHEIIGRTYFVLARYEEAERNERRAYDLRKEALGADNRETLESLHNLGAAQLAQAKFEDARASLEAALAGRRAAFGPTDADTLASLDTLAQLHQRQGDLAKAEQMLREVLAGRTKVLGPTHKETLGTRCSLADVIEYQGRLDEAEKYAAETVDLATKALGPDHTMTLTALNIHASTLQRMAKYAEAEAILRAVVPVKMRLYGPDHNETMLSENTLALILRDQNKDEEAEVLQRSLYDRVKKLHGPEHPTTLTYANNLAQLLRDMKKYEESESLFKTIIESRLSTEGAESVDTLISMNNYGLLLKETNRYEESHKYIKACYDGFVKKLAPDHWMLGLSGVYVGESLVFLKRYDEAEPYITNGYAIVAKAMGENHPRTRSAAEIAAKLYEAWGKPEKAAEWKARAEKK